MYTVTLTSEQHSLLMDILDCAVSELHSEIVRTENLCLKDALKERKHVLQALLEALKSLQPNPAT
jgi:hypothetical protein